MTKDELARLREIADYYLSNGLQWVLTTDTALELLDALDSRDALIKELISVAEFYSTGRNMGCSPSGDHDDPTWCDEHCGDYGKRARKALAKAKQTLGAGEG